MELDKNRYPELACRLKLAAPSERAEWAYEFAMDLAIGLKENAWEGTLEIKPEYVTAPKWMMRPGNDECIRDLNKKWAELCISDIHNFVSTSNYLSPQALQRFTLTDSGRRLAYLPSDPPTIFISYKHSPDVTNTLLIAREIREKTNAIPYHDESLQKQITKEIKEEIERSAALVCILGKDSMIRGSGVRDELIIAKANNKQIEFFWLKDYKRGPIDDQPDELKEWVDDQLAVTVDKENTKKYNEALNELINRLCKSDYISNLAID